MIGKLNLPVLADADVVVLGGGPSGVAAALAAARNGAQVLLVEQFGALGGLGTTGLVPMFAPTSDGERMIYGGIFREINLEMCSRMKVEPWRESWQAINPEILKRLLDEKIAQAGVRVLYCAKLCEAEMDGGRILAVLAATSMGLKKITGRVFVDATGDGLLAALSGAEFEYGDANGIPMSPTLCGQFSGIDWDKVAEVGKTGVNDHTIWAEMLRNGTAPLPEQHFVCMKPVSSRSASSNLGHIYGADCLDEFDLSRCYTEGRRILRILEEYYRCHVPGFEQVELISSAALLGVRETRRIRGEYRLTIEDYKKRAVFEDEIGRCCYPVDIHSSTTDSEEQAQVVKTIEATRFKKGESYGIPYRALIPAGIANLLVPGRAISSDRPIQSSIRVMPPCFVTGQAAGVAATLAAGQSDVRAVDTAVLQQRLAELGACFSQRRE
ncbi:MAG TPA: FAD-dependent oxidoreductase [Victivallis vadensis]|nr:FAD-dependent oxidoreductase [Victivallis vadensis]